MKQLKTNIYSLAFGGGGVGKVDGKVCFVGGALPGEEVIFDVVRDTSSYIAGEVREILTASPDRVKPECKYYGRCGGCQLQHLAYDKELFYKKEQVVQLIARISGIKDLECCDITGSPDCYHYRSSVTLHKEKDVYGYYDMSGKHVLGIDECSIAEGAINKSLAGLDKNGREDVTLKADHNGKVWSSERMGERFFFDRYGDMDICLSPKAFSQPNRYIAEMIVRTMEEWIGKPDENTVFFDIYCGAGFFSFLIKRDFSSRIGMDSSRVAIDCAKNTAKNSKMGNIKFYKGDAEKDFFQVFEREKGPNNILLIDPPRTGVDKVFLENIGKNGDINRIFYISCDPSRLSRDIKILTGESSWTLKKVKPFDMFPRTKHIETLAEFVRE
ncbi:MAG: methyltransferase domain-containing protein [Candidatus Omnitrophota bacterium]